MCPRGERGSAPNARSPCSRLPVITPAPLPDSEDCLYLNVFVPENAASEALPVIVFFPGGNYK